MHETNAGIFDEAKQNTFKNTPQFGMGLAVFKELDYLFVFLLFSVKYRIFASDWKSPTQGQFTILLWQL